MSEIIRNKHASKKRTNGTWAAECSRAEKAERFQKIDKEAA